MSWPSSSKAGLAPDPGARPQRRRARLAAVALSESARDFWVVAGTAAPIIALANQIVISDSLGLGPVFRSTRRGPSSGVRDQSAEGALLLVGIFSVSYINAAAQASVLLTALLSLAYPGSSDFVPLTLVPPIEVFGLLAVMSTAVFSGRVRAQVAQINAATRSLPAPEQTAAAIAATLQAWQNSPVRDDTPEPLG